MKRNAVITASNLNIGYPKSRRQEETTLYKDLSFNLYAGELTCLLGVNGSGKSTLLRTITGLQTPLAGEVLLNTKIIQKYTERELATSLGVVLTDRVMAGGLTVSELVSLGRHPYTGFFGRLSPKDNTIVEQAMNDVGIIHKANAYIAELSDGERQKVMIAKALAQECQTIVLDEPTAFLDMINRIEIMNLLHNLATTQNKAILLSTHDIELALALADRLWLLAKNKGLISGVTEDIVFSNSINDYLGNKEIVFDIQSGRFFSNAELKKKVILEADGDLFYWTKNFLSRVGYKLSNKADIKIKVISPNNITLNKEGTTTTINSFEMLRSALNPFNE